MFRRAALGMMWGIAALGACGGSDAIVSSAPATITIVAGDGQSGIVGRSLPDPLAIAVTNRDGAGVAGVTVEWTVRTGGGTLSASSVLTDGQGRASVTWTLGNVPGGQSVSATVTGLAGSPANFSATAIATAPIVLHYDGTGWSTALEYPVEPAPAFLSSIWGATASDVFAVGEWCGFPLVLRYDGTGWSSQPPLSCTGPSGGFRNFASVWGSSASDVFVVGNGVFSHSLYNWISHYDGQQWTSVYSRYCQVNALPRCDAGVGAVWSSSGTDAFAVGAGGTILHYDGTSWTPQASGTTEELDAVWGVGPGGAVFAVSDAGTILYYDRSTWRAQTSGTTQPLYAIWGTSANDVFTVGGAGTVLHYDGTAWTAQYSGSTQPLYGVWGSSGNAVFAVGDASTIVHYDGTTWTVQTAAGSMTLRGVWGSSPANVFAVAGCAPPAPGFC